MIPDYKAIIDTDNNWNLTQFVSTGRPGPRDWEQSPYNTPIQYNHSYGDFLLFWQESVERFVGFINIPKNMSTLTKSVLINHDDFTPVIQGDFENLQHIDLQEIQFFAIIRNEHERARSGYKEWMQVDPSLHNNRAGAKVLSIAQKQYISLDEVLRKPHIWDEHMEPQISFLVPFLNEGVLLKVFKLSSEYLAEAAEYFGQNIYEGLEWEESTDEIT